MVALLKINLSLNSLLNLSQSPAFSADNLKYCARELMQKYAKEAYRSIADCFFK